MKRIILAVLSLLLIVSSVGCSAVVAPQQDTEEAVRITMDMIRVYPQLRESLAFFDKTVGKGDFRLFVNEAKGYFMWLDDGKDIMLVYLARTPEGHLEIGPTSFMRVKPKDVLDILRSMKYVEVTDKTLFPVAITTAYQAATSFVEFLTLMSTAEFVPLLIPITPDLIDPLRQYEPVQG